MLHILYQPGPNRYSSDWHGVFPRRNLVSWSMRRLVLPEMMRRYVQFCIMTLLRVTVRTVLYNDLVEINS